MRATRNATRPAVDRAHSGDAGGLDRGVGVAVAAADDAELTPRGAAVAAVVPRVAVGAGSHALLVGHAEGIAAAVSVRAAGGGRLKIVIRRGWLRAGAAPRGHAGAGGLAADFSAGARDAAAHHREDRGAEQLRIEGQLLAALDAAGAPSTSARATGATARGAARSSVCSAAADRVIFGGHEAGSEEEHRDQQRSSAHVCR